ncbi:MAG: TIGR04255 family protein [Albidovulum sp.]|nr:TIGR04255 family protein [Albidovulum sp.]
MIEPRPLNPTPTREVPLPRAPLTRVIAQARFPPILTIRDPDKVAVLQEPLRETYPNLSQNQVHNIEVLSGQAPNVRQDLIWRLTDREKDYRWRVSLGVDFVALETSSYDSRSDFLSRLYAVVCAVEQAFGPASATRLGLRYIDRLTDEAVDRVGEMIQPKVLGIIQARENPNSTLGESVINLMTEAQFLTQGDTRVLGRWGLLPPNTTYDPDVLEPVGNSSWILDLDMFATESQPFASDGLLTAATGFAEYLYWLFRQMVTDEFLRFYGGKP